MSFFRLTEIIRRKNQAGCWVHEPSSRPEIAAEVCKAEYQWRTIALSMTSVNQFCYQRPFPSCLPWVKEWHHPSAKIHCPETIPWPPLWLRELSPVATQT